MSEQYVKAAKWSIHFINKAPLVGEEGAALNLAQSFLHAIASGELLVSQNPKTALLKLAEIAEYGAADDPDS